jgi:hypothetical protein
MSFMEVVHNLQVSVGQHIVPSGRSLRRQKLFNPRQKKIRPKSPRIVFSGAGRDRAPEKSLRGIAPRAVFSP